MIGWDTETDLIRPAVLAPELACLSYGDGERSELIHCSDPRARDHFEWLLRQPTATANGPYDLAVAWSAFPELGELVWDAVLGGRVHDVSTRQKLIDIGEGKYRAFFKHVQGFTKVQKLGYSLSDLHARYFGTYMEKDEWRLQYGALRFIPLSAWKEGAKRYPRLDANATALVYEKQELKHSWMKRHPSAYLHNEIPQVQASWVLTLMAMHGVRTDDMQVQHVIDMIDLEQPELKRKLMKAKLVRRDGTRNDKLARRLMYVAVGEAGELTKTGFKKVVAGEMTKDEALRKGYIKVDEEWCFNSGSEDLMLFDEYQQNQLLRTKVAHFKTKGLPLHTRYEVLLETGRTSSSEDNILFNSAALQNLPRKKGMRECIVAREGCALIASDYGQAELVSLAQICYNWFEKGKRPGDHEYVECQMIRTLNAGKDIHLDFAADLLGITYEEALARYKIDDPLIIEYRQMAKPVNFGFPGGLSVDSFVSYARKTYNVKLTKKRAKWLYEKWLQKFPEMKAYFKRIRRSFNATSMDQLIDETDIDQYGKFKYVDVIQEVSKRVRGSCRYTQACNTSFQGLTADAAKAALVEVSYRCYMMPSSALYGSRPVLFVHDEIIIESPLDRVTEAAAELEQVMVATYQRYTPDTRITADAHAMLRWSKKAKEVRQNGKLIPFRDEKFETELQEYATKRRKRAA